MSAPQPPSDHDPGRASGPTGPSGSEAGTTGDTATYDFHGEKLDFDPYRFGAPEPTSPVWSPPAPAGDPGRPPAPGERWSPDGGDPGPQVRPGDYWGGGSAPRPGDVFPPAGYAPPPAGYAPPPVGQVPTGQVPAGQAPAGGWPPPSDAPTTTSYAPAGGPAGGQPFPNPPGYPPPGAYPGRPGPDQRPTGNKLATVGFGLSMLGCVLFFTSILAIVIGGVGLGLSIAGLVRARRGAPHKTFAVLGIVFSIVAIAVGIAFIVYAFSQYDITCLSNLNGDTSRVSECAK